MIVTNKVFFSHTLELLSCRYSVLSEDDHVGRKASEHDVISEGSLEVEN